MNRNPANGNTGHDLDQKKSQDEPAADACIFNKGNTQQ